MYRQLIFLLLMSLPVGLFAQTPVLDSLSAELDSLRNLRSQIDAQISELVSVKHSHSVEYLKGVEDSISGFGIVVKVVSSGGKLRSKPSGSLIKQLPGDVEVLLYEKKDNFYRVKYNDIEGWLSSLFFVKTPEFKRIFESVQTDSSKSNSSSSAYSARSSASSRSSRTWVKGHYRTSKNGKRYWVKGHYRNN